MEAARFIIAGGAFSVAAFGAVLGPGTGTSVTAPRIVRPGPCAGDESYLLAGNSGAIIRIERSGLDEDRVIVFREQPSRGWASRRLLRRFDLDLDDGSPEIINSGRFCEGTQ